VSISHPEHLPKDVLLDLLPAAFEPWGSSGWYPSRPPTADSVERIESNLRIAIPRLFIDVAAACPSYGGWFNSIGDDYQSHAHILNLNAALHRGRTEDRRPDAMTPVTQHPMIEKLADIHQLSPDVRFGQLLANLGFLVEDQTDQTLREVEDDRLLEIMERHRIDLARRHADASPRAAADPGRPGAWS
jgi:hypothetical protein